VRVISTRIRIKLIAFFLSYFFPTSLRPGEFFAITLAVFNLLIRVNLSIDLSTIVEKDASVDLDERSEKDDGGVITNYARVKC